MTTKTQQLLRHAREIQEVASTECARSRNLLEKSRDLLISFSLQQQALHIKRAVMATLGVPHTGQHGGQRLLQPLGAGCQLSGIHVSKVYATRFGALTYI